MEGSRIVTDSIAMRDFSFWYPEQENETLKKLTLTVPKGEFLVLCGPSGCGKSTLLRHWKPALAPSGHQTGEITFEGRPLSSLDHREQSERIGFVGQSPENQLVTDTVWHELAFGLESLGCDTPTIRKRVAFMASFFGIQTWFHQKVTALSGGQKQLLNLASVMVMQPSVLILDEPTSQLDPIAASEFLAVLGKLNRELGTTILLSEHRLEETFPLADRVAVLDGGQFVCVDTPSRVGEQLKDLKHPMFLAMPTPMRIWASVESQAVCPVTVSEGRGWLADFLQEPKTLPEETVLPCGEVVLSTENLWFRYEKDSPDVVQGLSMILHEGELLTLVGGNGTGKTTALKLLGGLLQAQRGERTASKCIGILPQNPQTLFVKKTVREDLLELGAGGRMDKASLEARVASVVQLCRLETLLERHPYDLSGGEQQRAALAKILLLEPEILLLDEPTKGLDAAFKREFAAILRSLQGQGCAICMVSHDIEFCAQYASRVALFFDGGIVTEGMPRAFFSGNPFYTTAANRMSHLLCEDVVTAEELMTVCGGTLPPPLPLLSPEAPPLPTPKPNSAVAPPKKLSVFRKTAAILCGVLALILFGKILGDTSLSELLDAQGLTAAGQDSLLWTGLLLLVLVALTVCLTRKAPPPTRPVQLPRTERVLPKRTLVAAGVVLLLIPLTLFIGVVYLGGRHYYFIALLVLFECMAPFFLLFEGRKPKARELVLIAVLCAIAIAGRAAFFMLPQVKPVLALTILAGVALGGETGFLVGAVTMLLSNMLFSQGPLTPFQMFAMGIIGFLAGVLYRKGVLRRTRASLAAFGAVTALVVYGGIMNPAAALVWLHELNVPILLSYYLTGLPMDLIHAVSTALFLWVGAEPILEKLDRIKVKYGLLAGR